MKRNKLIYQSVYTLPEALAGVPLPSAHCVRSHLPQGDGFWRWRETCGSAERRPLGGAGERSETEGVLGLMGAAPHPALRATFPRRVKASVVAGSFLYV